MGLWLASLALLLLSACTFDAAPTNACRADADCPAGGCRDGVCITFATPLDEPVDPRDSADAGDAGQTGDASP